MLRSVAEERGNIPILVMKLAKMPSLRGAEIYQISRRVRKYTKKQETMSDMRSIRVIDFSGRTFNWERWTNKVLVRSKRQSYKKFLTRKDTVPTTKEYKKVVVKSENGEDIVRFNDLNEEAFEDIILSKY